MKYLSKDNLTYFWAKLKAILNNKQDRLTAGSNISISNNTISATDTTYNNATSSTSGLMSSADKSKLDSLENRDYVFTIDESDSSENILSKLREIYVKQKVTDCIVIAKTINGLTNPIFIVRKGTWTNNTSTEEEKYLRNLPIPTDSFDLSGNGVSYIRREDSFLTLYTQNDAVTRFYDDGVNSIFTTVGTISSPILRTDYNYSTPYTPLYNGSPTTKKYVDDAIATINSKSAISSFYTTTNIASLNTNTIYFGVYDTGSYLEFRTNGSSSNSAIQISKGDLIFSHYYTPEAKKNVEVLKYSTGYRYIFRYSPSTGYTEVLKSESLKRTNSDIVDLIYPIGSIYMSVNSTNPATLFGGTWEQIEDKFLLSSGTTYTAGDTGGESEVTLSTNQMPSHTHTFNGSGHSHRPSNTDYKFLVSQVNIALNGNKRAWWSNSGTADKYFVYSNSSGDIIEPERTETVTAGGTNTNTGGGQSHNNMPPYLVVNVWKRTA